MRMESWGILVVYIVFVSSFLGLTARMWSTRHDFCMAARLPVLVCIGTIGNVFLVTGVFFHWLMLYEDQGLPCYAMSGASNIWLFFFAAPFLIRALRLVISGNRVYRARFGRLVKWKMIAGYMVVICVCLVARAGKFAKRESSSLSRGYGCFFFDDLWISAAVVVAGGGPAGYFANQLRQQDDIFKIRREILISVLVGSLSWGTSIVLQFAVLLDALPDSRKAHLLTEIATVPLFVVPFIWGLLLPVAVNEKWCGAANSAVAPGGGYLEGSLTEASGVLGIARGGGGIAKRFGNFCKSALCLESWEFILDVVDYQNERSWDDQQENQHTAFTRILDEYLRPSSMHEVNVSSATRDRVASFKTREAFEGLGEMERREIFTEALNEVALMLENNLLQRFRRRLIAHWKHGQERATRLALIATCDKALTEFAMVPRTRGDGEGFSMSHTRSSISRREGVAWGS